ncbi:Zn-ribbon domain-containing OB-fold protein [Achromobacter denitrificans]
MFDVTMPPVQDALSQTFWEAARERRLLIQQCPTTGRRQWYPRAHSLADPGAAPRWVQASGRARLFSYTVISRGGVQKAPYTCVLVALEEGPLMLTRCPSDAPLRIDMPMKVEFVAINETLTLPVFVPAEP